MKKIIYPIIFIIGLTSVFAFNYGWDNSQYTITKLTTNTQFNNFYADGLNCYGMTGSNLTGGNGNSLRTVQTTNFPIFITVDNNFLNSVYDYSVSANYTITFNSFVWNDEKITLCIAVNNATTIYNSVYLGSNASGSDGDINRVLISNITNPLFVSVDTQILNNGYDYTNNNGNITFNSWLYDSQVISIWG